MTKTIEQYFRDWEANAFGYGYGTGEPHTLAALKAFFDNIGTEKSARGYDYRKLEAALSPTVAWLMINILCRAYVIKYGTSTRGGGWLTRAGERLKAFVDQRTVEELVEICCLETEDYYRCMPDACNCGDATKLGPVRPNPFWDRS